MLGEDSNTNLEYEFGVMHGSPEVRKKVMKNGNGSGITEEGQELEDDEDGLTANDNKSEVLILPDAFLKSKKKPLMVEYVQIESPSNKF